MFRGFWHAWSVIFSFCLIFKDLYLKLTNISGTGNRRPWPWRFNSTFYAKTILYIQRSHCWCPRHFLVKSKYYINRAWKSCHMTLWFLKNGSLTPIQKQRKWLFTILATQPQFLQTMERLYLPFYINLILASKYIGLILFERKAGKAWWNWVWYKHMTDFESYSLTLGLPL